MMYGIGLPIPFPMLPSLTAWQYDAGVLGGVLLHKPFLDAIENPTGVYIIPLISSSYSLDACVTSFFVAFIAFRMGRRGTIILGCIAAVIGSVI
jgi:MFS family permease